MTVQCMENVTSNDYKHERGARNDNIGVLLISKLSI